MNNIYDFTFEKLKDFFVQNSENSAKSKILYKLIYKDRINNFDDICEFGDKVKEMLKNNFEIKSLKLVSSTNSADTSKFLFELDDGHKIESVLMKHDYGNGICISSQIGCNMDCAFCESGKLKKIRNLTAGEMVKQILAVEKISGEKISHIVIMGIGEPFDNYENVVDFTDIVTEQNGLGFGAKHITISTCGIVPKIKEYANRNVVCNLAISLHAPNDELRCKIMPINKKYKISELISAVKEYTDKNNKKATFAYIMLKGINDDEKCANELCRLIEGINCYVNLIPYNKTSSSDFEKSEKEAIARFYDILKQNNVNVTVRREFGSELKAACGQLAAEVK